MTAEVEWWKVEEVLLKLATNKAHELKIRREIVPIVFLPGIMGSRLVRAVGEDKAPAGEMAWDPDDLGFAGAMATSWPAARKRRVVGPSFDGNKLVVAGPLPKAAAKALDKAGGKGKVPTAEEAAARGWGGVFWDSYGDLLMWLSGLAHAAALKDIQAPIPLDAIFDTPVYAIGYNWTDTNLENGKRIAAKIKDIIKREAAKGPCVRVILVTHSMGGLAARSASELANAKGDIQGIVHGVQPAVGAAAVYWRMRGGFERTALSKSAAVAKVLGSTGRDVTAVLAGIPGGLELAPHPDYAVPLIAGGTDKRWLRIFDDQNNLLDTWPKADAYAEIYRLPTNGANPPFWRLVDPLQLNPLAEDPEEPAALAAAIAEYHRVLEIAEKFARAIAGRRHPVTYAFWGASTDRDSATAINLVVTRKPRGWSLFEMSDAEKERRRLPLAEVIARFPLGRRRGLTNFSDRNTWKQDFIDSAGVEYEIRMMDPHGPGDGTVPAYSGSFLKPVNPGKVPSPVIAGDHQGAYDDGAARAFTEKAIGNLLLARMGAPDRLNVDLVLK